MNKFDYDILQYIKERPHATQRDIATALYYSLGAVNKSIRKLKEQRFIDSDNVVTKKLTALESYTKPTQAVILAAGFGLRMIPLNFDTPKGLIEVKGERLIERLIRQLQEKGIHDIVIVVGHLKEQYEYLIDRYKVTLLVNRDYATKNNLHSLYLARKHLQNAYVLPCDIRFSDNPFSSHEFYSWYALSDQEDPTSDLRMNRFGELVPTKADAPGQYMLGLAYLHKNDHETLLSILTQYAQERQHDPSFWETMFYGQNLSFKAKIFDHRSVHEFNTIADLRNFDTTSHLPDNDSLTLISHILDTSVDAITGIRPMKTGMTNRSFIFQHCEDHYVMRLPGEGSEQLVNRQQEYEVHRVLIDEGLADELVYFDPETGIKLARLLPNARVCDPENEEDLIRCMALLRQFHERHLNVAHYFDLFENIQFYEDLRGSEPSVYRDYEVTKIAVLALRPFIESFDSEHTLCHIDAVPDNFLFFREDCEQEEQLKMIDWEYAGMQDPHVDLAMFSVYAGYKKEAIDHLIDRYFENHCPHLMRMKIYAYVAVCGLLWSNWCEYKRLLGVDFGTYSLNQYRYAKDFARIVKEQGVL